jgi:hypothetical protein
MFAIQRRFYVPDNSALVVAATSTGGGARSREPGVRRLAGRRRSVRDRPGAPPRTSSAAIRVVERPVRRQHALAWHGPSVERDRRATYVADLLSFVLGSATRASTGGSSTAAWHPSASLHYQTLRYTGPLQVHLVAAPERAAEAHAVLCEEIAALVEPATFTDEEISNAKRQLEIDQIYESERPSHLTHTLGYWWAVADLDYYTDYAARVREITREDLHDFAHRYLVERPRVTGILVAARPERLGPGRGDRMSTRSQADPEVVRSRSRGCASSSGRTGPTRWSRRDSTWWAGRATCPSPRPVSRPCMRAPHGAAHAASRRQSSTRRWHGSAPTSAPSCRTTPRCSTCDAWRAICPKPGRSTPTSSSIRCSKAKRSRSCAGRCCSTSGRRSTARTVLSGRWRGGTATPDTRTPPTRTERESVRLTPPRSRAALLEPGGALSWQGSRGRRVALAGLRAAAARRRPAFPPRLC